MTKQNYLRQKVSVMFEMIQEVVTMAEKQDKHTYTWYSLLSASCSIPCLVFGDETHQSSINCVYEVSESFPCPRHGTMQRWEFLHAHDSTNICKVQKGVRHNAPDPDSCGGEDKKKATKQCLVTWRQRMSRMAQFLECVLIGPVLLTRDRSTVCR